MTTAHIHRIEDPDVEILLGLSAILHKDYVNPKVDPWTGSPFAWIKTRPSRQVGKIGEQLISEWAGKKGLKVEHSPDSEADRIIAGKRIEIKFSTLWKSGVYKFQQIRDQDYEYVICLGISPFTAHAWIFSKTELKREIIGHPAYSQHRGQRGSDTYWLSVKPGESHVITDSQPGTLEYVYNKLV